MNLAGKVLGGYEIGAKLGEGGMGVVHRATTVAEGPAGPAGAVVAIKVFHPDLVTDETSFARCKREAELGMKIQHEHVVATYEMDSAELEGTRWHFISMELVEGQTLRDLLAELKTVPEHLLYQVADQVLDALSAVHEIGMIHRDLKPENVVLTAAHKVLLMDLGVARLQQEGRDLTRAGEFVGSLHYASPEQFMDQDHVSPLADIYALGVVLYEMATGKNPFGDSELSALITQKIQGQVRRPKLVFRDLDPFLDEVILTCLNTDPAERFPDCDALRTVLRDGENSAWWQARIEGHAYPAAARALKRLRVPRETALVGRDTELDGLHACYEQARAGRGRVMLVSGGSGVGKSRLVHDFLEELVAPDGPLILAGRSTADDVAPHRAFLDAAADLPGERAGAEERLTELLPDLAPIVPELTQQLFGEASGNKEALVNGYTALLKNLGGKGPVVLVVEDLHCADDDTLALFGHLARALDQSPFLLAGTYRSDEVEDGSPLHALATELAPEERTATCSVEPLSSLYTAALVGSAVGASRTVRDLARPLHESSDGNPHILVETLAHLKETGVLVEGDEGWVLSRRIEDVPLPGSVRDLFRSRLDALDDEQRATLEAASVQGPDFGASLLASVTGDRRIKLLKRLAVLERKSRLIVSSGKNAFRFASRGLHRVFYDGMEEARRSGLHGQCADALTSKAGEDGLTGAAAYDVVRHLVAAGRAEETDFWLDEAVDHAVASLHPSAAAAFIAPLEARQPFSLSLKLAGLYELLGRIDDQLGALERAGSAARGDGDRACVLAGRALAYWRTGRHDEAETAGQEGLKLARASGDRAVEAECLHMLGSVRFRRGEFKESAGQWNDALAVRREIGDRKGEAATLQALGSATRELGDPEEALSFKQQALDIYREIVDRRGEGVALNNLGNSFVDVQRVDEALSCYEQAIALARELSDLPSEAAALRNQGRAFAVLGHVEDARDALELALDLYREVGDPGGEAETLDELGAVFGTIGERKDAIRCLQEARTCAEKTGEKAVLARILRHLANVHHEAGLQDEAWDAYEKALSLAGERGRMLTLSDMGNAAGREGDFGRAIDLLEQGMLGRTSAGRHVLSLCRLARMHKAAQRAQEAATYAEKAEELIKQDATVAPQYGPEIYYSLGTVYDDEDKGREYLETANQLLSERTRSIKSMIHRQQYVTMTWPNREILEEAKRLQEG